MRRRHRQIEIFSISALDLFASALGAFILVTMILFPYYGQGQQAAATLAKAETALAGSELAKAGLQERLDAATARLASFEAGPGAAGAGGRFLLVEIRWASPTADVDLRVTDPAGHEFFWYRANAGGRDYPESRAESGPDMTSGPAVEFWQDPAPRPGTYAVDFVANALPPGETVDVSGTLFDAAGMHPLPARTLRSAKERVRAATVTVGADGRVAIR